jgi:hypothetical protein
LKVVSAEFLPLSFVYLVYVEDVPVIMELIGPGLEFAVAILHEEVV